jgi:hypothetical protein
MAATSRRGFLTAAAGTVVAGGALGAPSPTSAAKRKPARRGAGVFAVEHGRLVARSKRLRVVFDASSGGIRSVTNVLTGQELLQAPQSAPLPWRLTAQQATAGQEQEQFAPRDFEFAIAKDRRTATLRWRTGVGDVRVEVHAGWDRRGDLALTPKVVNDRLTRPPQSLTYPLLPAPRTLSDGGADDYLVYPSAMGYLYRQPFGKTIPNAEATYPDGYIGLSMQVMGYFRAGHGGFYLASYDARCTRKYLHFSQAEANFEHVNWDLRSGVSMDLGYPVVIAPLARGDWYEVAEHYRKWALREAPWTRGGPKWGRPDSAYARWLHEEVGLAIWAPSGADWSPWYRFYAQAAGTKMHVSPNYDWMAPGKRWGGFEGYFPANFHPENVKAWQGHYVTPYQNDLYISVQAQDFATRWEPHTLPRSDYNPASATLSASSGPAPGTFKGGVPDPRVLGDLWYMTCPVTEPVKALHIWRDKTLVEQTGVHGSMYDISFGNPAEWMFCDRTEHGHTPGSGRWMIEHYIENARLSKQAMSKALGRYAAQGTETVMECVIDVVDFFQSRMVAGPQTTFEGRPQTGGVPFERPPGQGVEAVPFFPAVYHDYGPVLEDGWGQLSERHGEIFYWIASRVVLQFGGVYELNYEFGWPEKLPPALWDGTPPATFTPYDGAYWEAIDPPAPDAGKAAFLAEVARARTTFGNAWLGYGRLVRPTGAPSKKITLDYDHYQDWLNYSEHRKGTWDVPQLLEAAWIDPHGRLGLFFVNLSKDEDLHVDVDVDARRRWNTDHRGRRLVKHTSAGAEPIGRVGRDNHVRFSLTLPPRKVTLVAIAAAKR